MADGRGRYCRLVVVRPTMGAMPPDLTLNPECTEPLTQSDLAQKVLAAIERDIEPLLPAASYPRWRRLGQPFNEAMLFALGREKYLPRYGHVLLSRECVDALVKLLKGRRVLDVCAGGGFLAHTLANEGVEVEASDIYPPGPESPAWDSRTRWKVDFTGSSLNLPLQDYDVLLMVWPDHSDPFADQVAAAMRPGQLLVFQGEGKGTSTASDEFYDRVAGEGWRLLRNETEALNCGHVQFQGIHDYWYVLERIEA